MFSKTKPKTLEEIEIELDREEEEKNRRRLGYELDAVDRRIRSCQRQIEKLYPPEKTLLVEKLSALHRRLECEPKGNKESKVYKDLESDIEKTQAELKPIFAKCEMEATKLGLIDTLKNLQQIRDKIQGRSSYCPPEYKRPSN